LARRPLVFQAAAIGDLHRFVVPSAAASGKTRSRRAATNLLGPKGAITAAPGLTQPAPGRSCGSLDLHPSASLPPRSPSCFNSWFFSALGPLATSCSRAAWTGGIARRGPTAVVLRAATWPQWLRRGPPGGRPAEPAGLWEDTGDRFPGPAVRLAPDWDRSSYAPRLWHSSMCSTTSVASARATKRQPLADTQALAIPRTSALDRSAE
jgi:hypothetical protein